MLKILKNKNIDLNKIVVEESLLYKSQRNKGSLYEKYCVNILQFPTN